jgi:hypothetical protein
MDSQTKFISPKGDKRCMNPIIDKCDYVVYLKSNGVDSDGHVIKSSGYLAQTDEFFARARIEYTPTYIKEFTAENLTKAIQEGIDKKRELDHSVVTSFSEQQKLNTVKDLDFDALMIEFNNLIKNIPGSSDIDAVTEDGNKFKTYWAPKIVQITEKYLGKGCKVSQCNVNQVEALSLIVDEVSELLKGDK